MDLFRSDPLALKTRRALQREALQVTRDIARARVREWVHGIAMHWLRLGRCSENKIVAPVEALIHRTAQRLVVGYGYFSQRAGRGPCLDPSQGFRLDVDRRRCRIKARYSGAWAGMAFRRPGQPRYMPQGLIKCPALIGRGRRRSLAVPAMTTVTLAAPTGVSSATRDPYRVQGHGRRFALPSVYAQATLRQAFDGSGEGHGDVKRARICHGPYDGLRWSSLPRRRATRHAVGWPARRAVSDQDS